MKYKGILLDIDNTLYDYKISHQFALERVLTYCEEELHFNKEEVLNAFKLARYKVHLELTESAASHNRLLYFQKMLEILRLNSLKYGLKVYNIYWDHFLDKMIPFEGIYDLFDCYKNKICLVTDLTAHIQFRKVHKLGLDNYCDMMVTSEEAGKEKPHPYVFMKALNKLQLSKNEVCMIGDNFNKDILGATNMGINSIWLNHENQLKSYDTSIIKEVKSIKDIIGIV